jgi:protease IV
MDPRKKRIFIYCLAGAVILSMIYAAATPGSRTSQRGSSALGANVQRSNSIGLIYIEGEIAGGHSASGLMGSTQGGDSILSYIRQAQNDPTIKALVLRINSPGGSAAASDEIARELRAFRRSGRPVIASMSDVAASGAYWVATAADKIWASQSTMTGSIGVIFEVTRLDELYQKIGVQVDVVKSGPFKDIGSSARGMTADERRILQGMVDDVYDQFVTQVADGRKMKKEDVKKLADGRVWTGRQAKELGLVDELGNLYDAVNDAAKIAGLKSWTVRELGRMTPLERLIQSLPTDMGSSIEPALSGDRFKDAIWFLRDILKTPGF